MNSKVGTKLFRTKKRVIWKGPRVTRKGPRFAISLLSRSWKSKSCQFTVALFIQKSILLQFLVKWKVVRFYLVNWKVVILLEIIRKFQWIDEMLSYIFNMHVFGNLNENPINLSPSGYYFYGASRCVHWFFISACNAHKVTLQLVTQLSYYYCSRRKSNMRVKLNTIQIIALLKFYSKNLA